MKCLEGRVEFLEIPRCMLNSEYVTFCRKAPAEIRNTDFFS